VVGHNASIAEHAFHDYVDVATSKDASSCSYKPKDIKSCGVINASAYRAFLLTRAAADFSKRNTKKSRIEIWPSLSSLKTPTAPGTTRRMGKEILSTTSIPVLSLKPWRRSRLSPGIKTVPGPLSEVSTTTLGTCLIKKVCPNRFPAGLGLRCIDASSMTMLSASMWPSC